MAVGGNERAGGAGFDGGAPRIHGGSASVTIDLRCYRLTAIQKTAYRLADRCTVILGPVEEYALALRFDFPGGTTECRARDVLRLFFQELLDQELREKVGEETRPWRSLILAHAFSRTDLLRRDE